MPLPWKRFRELTPSERYMFIRAMILFPVTACSLRIFGLRGIQQRMGRLALRDGMRTVGNTDRQAVAVSARRMTEAASRYGLVRGNCLSRSIVLWHLLHHAGVIGTLHIGGRKEGPSFEAHAWVELDGRTISESEEVRASFTPFEGQASILTREK